MARAITSPAGVALGSSVAAGFLASGAPVGGAVIMGLAAWALPVVRAMHQPKPNAAPSLPASTEDLPHSWEAPVSDARRALKRYRRSLAQCPSGPLRRRLEDLEDDFEESVRRCEHLARWGAEAEMAEKELDPNAVERAARHVGDSAHRAAADQREVRTRLETVQGEAKARLALINARLDEAVGRAVEMVGRAGQARDDGAGGLDMGAGELASELGALRSALEEVGHPERRRATEG